MTTSTTLAAYHSLPIADVMQRVLEAIEIAGDAGMTCDEIAEHTGIEYRTVTPRIAQLEKLGLVYRAGDTRKGKSGRGQLVVRAEKHKATTPLIRAAKKGGFIKGLMHAAKLLLRESDLGVAKKRLGDLIRKEAMKP